MALNGGKTLCVFGVKGGIGKSVLTLNLAGVASNSKIKTLIIDMDIYGGSIAFSLNKEVKRTIYNFVDDYNNNRYEDLNDYITKYNEYIDFIACPKDPRKSNKIDSKYLDILINKAKFNYDLILIDTNHILNEINLNILDKSDDILFVLSNDILNIKNMRNLIAVFQDLEKNNYKILLNNSYRNDKNDYDLHAIRDIIKDNVDYTISDKYYIKNMSEYIKYGEIITLNKKYVGTRDYKVLDLIIENELGDIDGKENSK